MDNSDLRIGDAIGGSKTPITKLDALDVFTIWRRIISLCQGIMVEVEEFKPLKDLYSLNGLSVPQELGDGLLTQTRVIEIQSWKIKNPSMFVLSVDGNLYEILKSDEDGLSARLVDNHTLYDLLKHDRIDRQSLLEKLGSSIDNAADRAKNIVQVHNQLRAILDKVDCTCCYPS